MNRVVPESSHLANPHLEPRLKQIKIVHGDITEAQGVEAVISVLPQNLEYRGKLNRALAEKSGQDLARFVKDNIFAPRSGDVYAVPAGNLPCAHILFAILPAWRTEFDRKDKELVKAVRRALEEARAMGLRHVAIAPVACGQKGFPKNRAARLILQGIMERLHSAREGDDFEEIRIVCLTAEMTRHFREKLQSL